MNERAYLKRMIPLTAELEAAATAEPYDPDAYNNVIKVINKTRVQYERRQKRIRWINRVVWILVVLLLAWLIFFGNN